MSVTLNEDFFAQITSSGVLGVNKEGKTVVKGLHNWYQFLLEQTAGRLAYSPPQKNVDTTKKVRV